MARTGHIVFYTRLPSTSLSQRSSWCLVSYEYQQKLPVIYRQEKQEECTQRAQPQKYTKPGTCKILSWLKLSHWVTVTSPLGLYSSRLFLSCSTQFCKVGKSIRLWIVLLASVLKNIFSFKSTCINLSMRSKIPGGLSLHGAGKQLSK